MIENEYSSLEKLPRDLESKSLAAQQPTNEIHNISLLVAVIILAIFQRLIQSVKLYK